MMLAEKTVKNPLVEGEVYQSVEGVRMVYLGEDDKEAGLAIHYFSLENNPLGKISIEGSRGVILIEKEGARTVIFHGSPRLSICVPKDYNTRYGNNKTVQEIANLVEEKLR